MVVVVICVMVVIAVPIVVGASDGVPSKGVEQPSAASGRRRRTAAAEPDATVTAAVATVINETGSGPKVGQSCGGSGGRGTSNPDPCVHQTGLHGRPPCKSE